MLECYECRFGNGTGVVIGTRGGATLKIRRMKRRSGQLSGLTPLGYWERAITSRDRPLLMLDMRKLGSTR